MSLAAGTHLATAAWTSAAEAQLALAFIAAAKDVVVSTIWALVVLGFPRLGLTLTTRDADPFFDRLK
jgi:hypothetical protein